MSINIKPHQSEPFTVTEPDGYGGTVERVSDAWYNYLDSIDREVNFTIDQSINNVSFSQSNHNFDSGAHMDRIDRTAFGIQANIASALASAPDTSRLEREIASLRADIQSLRFIAESNADIERDLKKLSSIVAQLAQPVWRQEEFKAVDEPARFVI